MRNERAAGITKGDCVLVCAVVRGNYGTVVCVLLTAARADSCVIVMIIAVRARVCDVVSACRVCVVPT